ncbi:MAG: InlB B-repeat-containing protein [Clostridia bacterium]|nr:InlB B-repeat-containing protein [Clostridia bacterium]
MNNNENRRCCYCGETIENLALHGGIRKIRCESCGHEWIEPSEETLQEIYDLHTFCDEVISIMSHPGSLKQKRELWRYDTKLKDLFEQHSAQTERKAFFAICCAAYQTCGFLAYKNFEGKDTETEAKEWYTVAKDYLDAHPTEKNEKQSDKQILKRYVHLYEKRLLHKKRNRSLITVSVVGGVLVLGLTAGAIIGSSYTPVKNDPATGITITIPNDAVSMFEKIGIQIDAEQKSQKSVAYIDAKNALRNETGTFVLYDIALLGGKDALDFDGTVKVEVPIPEGFDTSAMKVYHIVSDEEYEEIPCSVSLAKNTITFETTHFSYYAVAERHPLLSFDTVGAGEIEMQSVKRDTLASEPTAPQKTGYTFGGWMFDGELWDFSADTVKKDITLTASWIPNQYEITLNAGGGSLQTQSIRVPYMSAYENLPANVAKSGYTFIGWFTSAEGGTQVTRETILTTAGNLTLYARFRANDNQVHFQAGGGIGEMAPLTIPTGGSAKLPNVTFTRLGYTFVGWATSPDGEAVYENRASFAMDTQASHTLWAVWEANTNTLKFNANGGIGSMNAISLQTGQSFNLPANAFAREGYVFIGWSTTAGGQAVYTDLEKYTMGTSAVTTLYAVWETNTNKVVFHSNNGIGAMAPIRLETGETAELPKCTFTKTGYTFLGWSDTPDGRVLYADGSRYVMGNASSYTLYAVWEAKEYHISFDANGGTGEMASLNIKTGETRPLPVNKFERPGYTFKGWNTAHGDLIEYENLAEYTMTAAKDVVLYAVWEASVNELHFHAGGGSGTMNALTIKTGNTVYLPVNRFTRPGYTFIGWSKTNGGSVDFNPGARYQMGSDQKYTLYAVWKENTNKVCFNANGGTGAMDPMDGKTNGTIKLPECGFNRNGYVFVGWSTTAGSHTADYAAGAIYTVGPEATVTLYAVWSGENNQVVFNSNGGEGTMAPINIPTGNTAALTENRFTRPGYTFAGWATSAGGEKVYDDGADFAMTTPDTKVLYAVWIAKSNAVQFDANGGTGEMDAMRGDTDSTITLPGCGFERKGYSFVGWSQTEGSLVADYKAGDAYTVSHDEVTTLYAVWVGIPNQLILSPNGGTGTIKTVTVKTGDKINLPANTFERPGYTFVGWSNTPDGNVLYENEALYVMGTEASYTLYAKWEKNTNTIAFDKNGGSGNMNPMQAKTDSEITLPACGFNRKGYKFIGWSKTADSQTADYEAGARYQVGTEKTVTLYAVWKAEEYTVSFDSNGGTGKMDFLSIKMNETKNLPSNQFTKPGWTFAGWATSANGEKVYDNCAAYVMTDAENVTLYAVWKENTNTVSFDKNGGTGEMKPIELKTGKTIFLPANTFTRAGYTFAGWSTSPNGNVEYKDKASYTMGTETSYTLYAKWEANTNTLKFPANKGTDEPDSMEAKTDSKITLPACGAKRKGYSCIGWSKTENSNTVEYGVGATYTVGPESEVTFYPVWVGENNQVVFNPNGGTGIMNPINIATDKTAALTANQFTRPGYTFVGWATSADGEKVYDNGAIFEMRTPETVVLYAVWSAHSYKVKYDSNGGNGTMIESDHVYGTSKKLSKNTFTKTGYHFVGWSTEKNGDVVYKDEDAVQNLTSVKGGTVTLYVKWDENPYTVIYDSNGGNGTMSDSDHVYGTPPKQLTKNTFTKIGYHFVGWSLTKDGPVQYKDEEAVQNLTSDYPDAKVTLYAQWDKNPYTVKYDSNGGNGTMSNSDHVYDTPKQLNKNTFTKTGYHFIGWSTEKNGDVVYKNGEAVQNLTDSGTFTLYAKWEVNIYTITVQGIDGMNAGTDTKGNPKYGVKTLDTIYFTVGDPTKGMAKGFYQDSSCTVKLSSTNILNNYRVDSTKFDFGGLYSEAIDYNGHSYANANGVRIIDANGTFVSDQLRLNDTAYTGTLYALAKPKQFTITLNYNETSQLVLSVTNAATTSVYAYYNEKPETISVMPNSKYYKPLSYQASGSTAKFSFTANGTASGYYNVVGNSTVSCQWTKKYADYNYVYDVTTLSSIRKNPSAKYLLLCDIDLNGAEWTPIDTFSGTLDGDGHSIHSFSIVDSDVKTEKNVGFFRTNDGTIKNLTIGTNTKNLSDFSGHSVSIVSKVNEASSESVHSLGAIVGNNRGTIYHCFVDNVLVNGELYDRNNNDSAFCKVGGVAGSNFGTIERCSVESSTVISYVTAKKDSGDNNYAYAGGITGYNESTGIFEDGKLINGVVKDCVSFNNKLIRADARGDGDGDNDAYPQAVCGGLVGDSRHGGVYNSAAYGNVVEASASTGGNTFPLVLKGLFIGATKETFANTKGKEVVIFNGKTTKNYYGTLLGDSLYTGVVLNPNSEITVPSLVVFKVLSYYMTNGYVNRPEDDNFRSITNPTDFQFYLNTEYWNFVDGYPTLK